MKNSIYLLAILLCALLMPLASCSKDSDEPQVIAKRTLLVYMVASNSLASCDIDDVSEIEASISANGMNDCRLLIYWVNNTSAPRLVEIVKKGSGTAQVVHKTYDEKIKSTTQERMQMVISDVFDTAPANDYGMILWSHASGWASSLTARSTNASLMDFGDDRGTTMPIDVLADAIPENSFSFIYTDACYMAGIEVAYQLKDKTRYFIGSVTELPIDGMDYINNIPCFLADEPDLIQCCKNTYEKYNKLYGSAKSCTISLIDCSKLDALASICKDIHMNGIKITNDYDIQKYKRTEPYLFYDFAQYTKLMANESQVEEFNKAIADAVVYKAATPYIFNSIKINPENYSGLSTYILGMSQPTSVNESYYKVLSWYNDVIKQ